jgi:hypothetical protein
VDVDHARARLRQAAARRQERRRLHAITRAELRGAVQEADNWLKKDYATLVADMETVFGVGRVKELFAPEAGAPGTKTLTARKKLTESTKDLDALDKSETQAASAEGVRASAQRRRRVIANVDWVYRHDEFNAIQQDYKCQDARLRVRRRAALAAHPARVAVRGLRP